MSESINSFSEELQAEIQAFEESFAQAGERIRTAKEEEANALQLIVDQTKTQLAELKSKVDASAADLRAKIDQAKHDAKDSVDDRIEELKQKYNAHLTEVQKSWSNAVTDITGGAIF